MFHIGRIFLPVDAGNLLTRKIVMQIDSHGYNSFFTGTYQASCQLSQSNKAWFYKSFLS